MQAGGGLVEYEHGRLGTLVSQKRRQLHALVLAARQRRRRLAEPDVAQADVAQRLKAPDDAPLRRSVGFAEEFDGAVDSHVEYVVDVESAVFHLQHLALESLAAAGLAGDGDVGQELHGDGDGAVALAFLAAAADGVERKVGGGQAELLRRLLRGHQGAYLVVSLQISGRIGARRLADRVLIDEHYVAYPAERTLQLAEPARLLGGHLELTTEGAVEDVADEGRLARAADTRHGGHHAEREAHGDVLEVVFGGMSHLDVILPLAPVLWHRYRQLAGKIFGSIRTLSRADAGERAGINYLAAEAPGVGADVDQHICRAHDFLVMLDHDDRVAEILKLLEHTDQAVGVARMEADRRLIKYIQRAYQAAAERRGQVDALTLAARQRVAQTVERQIAQSDFIKIAQTVVDFSQQPRSYLAIVGVKLQVGEPPAQILHRHAYEVGDGAAGNLHVQRITAEARTAAFGTGGLGAESRVHHAILDLVALRLHPFEEAVNALPLARAVPENILFFLGQLEVRTVDRESELRGVADEQPLPFAHRRPAPWRHSVVVDRQLLIRNHKRLVDAESLAEALARGAGAVGIVEVEHLIRRLHERHSVGLEALREVVSHRFRRAVGIDEQRAAVVTLVEGRLGRFGQARQLVALAGHGQTVDQHIERAGVLHYIGRLGYVDKAAVGDNAREPLLAEDFELDGRVAALENVDRRHHGHARAFGISRRGGKHVLHGVLLDHRAGHGRIGFAHTPEQQAHVVVNFSRCSDGRARVARIDLLLDGHGRGQAAYEVALGLGHLAQKLAGIGREALDVAASPLGVKRVESQRRLARARQPRDNYELSAWQRQIDVFQIVDACALDCDILFLHNIQSYGILPVPASIKPP